jgi:3-deoxy-manno-octulosonate cytidylyltransferase (CMP-KDO synthetase)
MSNASILGVIPARLASTRLPRKVLRELAGKPLVEWVWRAAVASAAMDAVIVATDSDEVMEVCRARGIVAEMTSADCASGSDRVFEIAQRHPANIYVNIQGDEPLLTTAHFRKLLAPFSDEAVDVTTLAVRCAEDEVDNPNAVKVVTGADGRALYFSRAAIPFDRDGHSVLLRKKHLGIYAYRRAALERFAALAPSPLELTEKLEQLRMLENGMRIVVADVALDTIGVDTEEDLLRAEALLLDRINSIEPDAD